MYQRCPNPLCRRPFQVNRFRNTPDKLMQGGKITCPHCGLIAEAESMSIFLTHALSEEQEADFNARDPRQEDPQG